MQEYVQKSTRTTLPFSPSRVSGVEFTQATAPSKPGKVPSLAKGRSDARLDIIMAGPVIAARFEVIITGPCITVPVCPALEVMSEVFVVMAGPSADGRRRSTKLCSIPEVLAKETRRRIPRSQPEAM